MLRGFHHGFVASRCHPSWATMVFSTTLAEELRRQAFPEWHHNTIGGEDSKAAFSNFDKNCDFG